MVTSLSNTNYKNNFLEPKDIDEAFYSSFDSDEDKEEEKEKNNLLLKSSKKNLIFTGMNVTQNDIYTKNKRQFIIQKLIELKHIHYLKRRNMKNSPITWELFYKLLFHDYFNMLKYKKITSSVNIFLTSLKGNNSGQKEIIFNLRELELRMKKIIDKINKKENSVYVNSPNPNINYNCNEGFENSFHKDEVFNSQNNIIELPTKEWIDTPLSSIIKPKVIANSEQGNFIPSYISAFTSSIENELHKMTQFQNKKEKIHRPSDSSFLNKPKLYIKKPLLTSSVGSSKNLTQYISVIGPAKKTNHLALDSAVSPLIRSSISRNSNKNIREFSIPNNDYYNKTVIENQINSTETNYKNAITEVDNSTQQNYSMCKKDNKKTMQKYVDILNNPKNVKKLIRKYPQYENDIMNIKNKFLSYEIELNKDEHIFVDPINNINRPLIDFNYDSEAQKDVKLNKKFQLKSKILNYSKKIDSFIHNFNTLMDNDEIRNEFASYHN